MIAATSLRVQEAPFPLWLVPSGSINSAPESLGSAALIHCFIRTAIVSDLPTLDLCTGFFFFFFLLNHGPCHFAYRFILWVVTCGFRLSRAFNAVTPPANLVAAQGHARFIKVWNASVGGRPRNRNFHAQLVEVWTGPAFHEAIWKLLSYSLAMHTALSQQFHSSEFL